MAKHHLASPSAARRSTCSQRSPPVVPVAISFSTAIPSFSFSDCTPLPGSHTPSAANSKAGSGKLKGAVSERATRRKRNRRACKSHHLGVPDSGPDFRIPEPKRQELGLHPADAADRESSQ
ncbi:MAG: hypothetical protein BJ554DRAFT_1829 [Olpidium bornovanus]|uniref:Uncharacterized protein n=1 Tax=Olpidium bornovanus TaxID=278681 RepID=A0A8H8DH50_9FUNG|nr:MAG: hypothetical protein BJ554DRAFT_1829 [Olpidium bornovanus]